jgi:HEAT repeat protein/cyclophilin family peptidyl-prolyl cis-trans isomerase
MIGCLGSSRPARRPALIAVLFLVVSAACKSVPTPVATPAPLPPPVALDTRVSWILRLEQQRMLRDADLEAAPEAAAHALAPARTPDLTVLLSDTEPAVRRRAALALGRVARAEAVPALSSALADPEEAVRASAAFALGLIGAAAGVDPLEAALKDPSPLVRARAVEGLGLIGESSAASAVADAAAGCAETLAGLAPDDEGSPQSPAIELCRLALFSLVRLKQYEPLARVALDQAGQPVSLWWPVAFALQRLGDKRAAPALLVLASTHGVYTPAFALRGLGAIGDTRAAPVALALATDATADVRVRISAIRALGQIGGAASVGPLLQLVADKSSPRNLTLEAVTALGSLADRRAFDPMLDLLTDSWPAMRAASLAAAAKINPDGFLLVASGLPPDPDWSVRAALADVLATLPADQVRTAIADLTTDADARVCGPALRALAKVGSPDLPKRLFDALDASDFVVRATSAELIGDSRAVGGVERLTAAYARGESDAAYLARASALGALAKYGSPDAKDVLRKALGDKAWPVRWRAAELLRGLGETDAAPAVPAPFRQPLSVFDSPAILHPTFSPHAFIETHQGTIELELNLVEAPVTSQAFVDLARAGFFNGMKVHRLVPNFVIQAGDPRGDGEGGPEFTLMDELSPLPFVRGTVGMALDWRDTGGSQFFITVSPQPHLDAKYTVFGKVVRGEEWLDRISQGDVIDRIRIWDGVNFE